MTDTIAPVAPKLVTNAGFTALVDPQVTFHTTLGDVVFQLDPDKAPVTVANMLAYVNTGFYDGTLFHRVIPGFVAQGGGLTSGLAGKAATYAPIVLESANGLPNLRGTLAMARTNVADSATSQFFVNLVDNNFLNYTSGASPGYAVFGYAVAGMSVIDLMAQQPTATIGPYANVPVTDIRTVSAEQTLGGTAITHNAVFSVSGLEAGASWKYSLDSGATWIGGTGSSFAVPAGTYADGAVRVMQQDAAGNASTQGVFTSALLVGAGAPTGHLWAGTAAGEVVPGTAQDDRMDAGGGIDTLAYSFDRSSYTINISGNTASISGPEGTDLLANVERLVFQDVQVALDVDGHAGQAYRLYKAAFDRVPDIGGLGYQMNDLDHGWALTWVAGNFVASPEFQSTYGTLSDTGFVTQLYWNVLDRAPDAGGLAYHVERLKTVPRGYILAGFSESPENQANVIGAIGNGMEFVWP